MGSFGRVGPSFHLVCLVWLWTCDLYGVLPLLRVLLRYVMGSTCVLCRTALVVVGSRDIPGLLCLFHKLCSLAMMGSTDIQAKYSLCFLQRKFAAHADFPPAVAKPPIVPGKANLKPPRLVTGLYNLNCICGVDKSMKIQGQMLSW